MSSNHKSVRVGELLVDAQIIGSAEMTEAIQVSKRLGVPIGRVLMMSGSVRQDELAASLQVQPLIREGQIPYDAAISALKRVHQLRMGMADALAQEDLRPDLEDNPEFLGELLLDSNLVAPEEMEQAVQTSMSSGIPLGSALVLQGLLSPALFPSLQRIQRQLIEGTMSRDEGIKQVQDTFMLWLKAEESKDKAGEALLGNDSGYASAHNDSLQTGSRTAPQITAQKANALVAAPITTPLPAAAMPAASSQSAAPVAVAQSEAAPSAQAVQTEELQAPAVTSDISAKAAAASTVAEPARISEDKKVEDIRLVDMLKSAGVFTQSDVQKRYEAMLRDPVRSGKFFFDLGLLDEEEVKAAVRSHTLMTKGSLTKEEAIVALNETRSSALEKEIDGERGQRNAADREWRGKAGVIGGAVFGALIAGIFSTRGKK